MVKPSFLLPVGAVILQRHSLRQLYAFSSLQHGMHKNEFGLEAGDLLCEEKLSLHTHCTVASHLVIVRGMGPLVLMES